MVDFFFVFSGPHETGIAHYKHVYFNSTWNTFKMWALTIIAIIVTYESFRRVIELFLQRKLRGTMGLLFFSSLHSNYYAWWATWGYWNDEFYDQWYHQLFFTVTELITTTTVFRFLDRRKPVQPLSMFIVANIALFHILSSSTDQFVLNVILLRGRLHQVLRDLGIMFTDLIYLSVSTYELKMYSRLTGESLSSLFFHEKHIRTLSTLTFVMFLYFLIFLRF